MEYFLDVIQNKYMQFTGRARRSEYWYFTLFTMLGYLGLAALSFIHEYLIALAIIFILGVIIPGIAVTVRRLHDTGRSGWFYFLAFIPLVGGIIVLVFLCQDSQEGTNEYGPNPKNPEFDVSDNLVDDFK